MIYIHNAIICIIIAVIFVVPLAYYNGKTKGYSQGYSEAEDVWKKTVLDIEKSSEDRIDIYKEEVEATKSKYEQLCDQYEDNYDDTCSGILEDY